MKSFKTIARVGYYNGTPVIKGLHAKPWDAWYRCILNGNGSRITGIAGEYLEDDLIWADDSEISHTRILEVELTIAQ